MKRRVSIASLLFICTLFLTTGLPGHGRGAPFVRGNAYKPGARGPAARISGPLMNPAMIGGVSFSLTNPKLPFLNTALPGLNSPTVAVPLPLSVVPGVSMPLEVSAAQAPVQGTAETVLQAVAGISKAVSPKGGKERPTSEIRSASNGFFDNGVKMGSVDAEGAMGSEGTMGSGKVDRRSRLTRLAEENDALSQIYPKVVFITDTFGAEVPETTVALIEKLLVNHVHVVFITARPARGPNSADSVLVSKIKPRTGNPLIVASYNGANITARNSKSENPAPIVDDLPGFPEGSVAKFRAISAKLRRDFHMRGNLAEFGMPDSGNAMIYGAELPNKTANIQAWAAAFNKALAGANMPHRVETGVNPNGRPYFFIQSAELHLNTNRIFNALNARFPELAASLKPSEILVLGDPKKTGKFIKSLPGKGYHLHNVYDEASSHDALASVLGVKSHKQVMITRSKIRAYISWEARKNNAFKRRGSGSGDGGGKNANKAGAMHRNLGFYRGIIVYNLMPKLYRLMRKGQFDQATLEAATDLLRRMWYNPLSEWVRINDELETARRSPIWKSLEKGYLEATRIWLANYYKRNFADYPRNLGEEVIGKLINTHMDIGNGISISFTSPYTDNRYVVKVLPNRVFLEYDDEGPVLIAHVDRSGKEPYQQEFDESLETNMVARATLKGYGELRADGLWYVNDEANPRVRVVFHYNTRDLSHIYTPQELESNSAEVTALIDRMQADQEFLDDFDAQNKKNSTLTDVAKKRKQEAADKKKAQLAKQKRNEARLRKAARDSKKKPKTGTRGGR